MLQLTGHAVVAAKTTVTIGPKSPEYAIFKLDDGTGNCLIYVEVAALPPAALERTRDQLGLAMRVVVRSKKAKYEGTGMAEIDVLVVESFELPNQT